MNIIYISIIVLRNNMLQGNVHFPILYLYKRMVVKGIDFAFDKPKMY